MQNDDRKDREIAEIQRRMDYLRTTDEISLSEKIAILRNVLEIIEASEAEQIKKSIATFT